MRLHHPKCGLYILAANGSSARRLADEVYVYDAEETNRALGGGIEQQQLVTLWWD